MEEKKVEMNDVAQEETKDVTVGDHADEPKQDSGIVTQSAEPVDENKENGQEAELKDAGDELVKILDIEVKESEIDKQIEEVARQYSSEVKLPGFRKGKVPVEIVKKRFKQAVADEALNKVVEHAVIERVKKENLDIVGSPTIKELDYNEGSDLKAKVAVEVFPEVTLPQWETLEIEVQKSELAPEYDEAKQIDGVLNSNKRRVLVSDREIKEEDIVGIKIQSQFMDNRRMTPRRENEVNMADAERHEISGIFEQLKGKKIGDKIEFSVSYPEDYRKKPWAGKELTHFIEIMNIYEMIKPELNEEFFKSFGIQDEETFKKKLREEFNRYTEQIKEDRLMSLLTAKVIESVDFPLPQSLVMQELEREFSEGLRYINIDDPEQKKQYVRLMQDSARRSVKSMLVFDAIRKEFKIEVSNDDMEKEFKEIAEKNNVAVAQVRKVYANPDHKNKLKDNLLSRKMVEFLREKISIKEV